MAEAAAGLALAASIVQLIDFGSRLTERLKEFNSDIGEATKSFGSIKVRLPLDLDTLRRTKELASGGHISANTVSVLLPLIEACTRDILALESILDKILPPQNSSSWQKRLYALKSLASDKNVEQITSRLESRMQSLASSQSITLSESLVLLTVPQAPPPERHEKPVPTDPGMPVAGDCGKQHVVRNDVLDVGSDGIKVSSTDDSPITAQVDNAGRFSQLFRRTWYLVGTIALAAVLAGVVGGVVGSRRRSGNSTSQGASQTATLVARNIAAVSYVSGFVNTTKVYYQDSSGRFMEAVTSLDTEMWNSSGLGFSGRNGSAIAAAVSRPDFDPLQICLLYLDPNKILHDIIYNGSTNSWSSGNLADQQYVVSANSSLSAMYNQCRLCSNTTIIAFQDQNEDVVIGNLTSAGWTLTQLGLIPQLPTGLALQPFYRSGMEDQINLYYQKTDLTMNLASWKPAIVNNGVYGWSLTEQTYSPIRPSAPIAAASSYSNVSTGFASWIEVLSPSSSSIKVNTWSGAINDW